MAARSAYVWGQPRAPIREREEGEQSEPSDTEGDESVIDIESDGETEKTYEERANEGPIEGYANVHLEGRVEGHADGRVEGHLETLAEIRDEVQVEGQELQAVKEVSNVPSCLISRLEIVIHDLRANIEHEAQLRTDNQRLKRRNEEFEEQTGELIIENQRLKRRNEELAETIDRVEKERDEFRADYEIYKDAARANVCAKFKS